jgi:PTH1 family peptidyl-tRNA hydrolase
MKLIVGLGNPGDRYQGTRHNAGFWLVERFAVESHTTLRKDAKFEALVGRHEASGIWLMLPQSHMNLSGKPVQMLASFFRIAPADILVAHDELDFPPGTVRMKQGGGAAGHNGLKDISARIASHDYWRLRIGIGHPGDRRLVTDYVLHKPAQEERAAIDAAIGQALEVLQLVLAGDLQGAMLKLHSRQPVEPAAPPEKTRKSGKSETPVEVAKVEPAEKSKPAAKSGKPEKAAKAGKAEPPAAAEKAGGFGSFLKKFLPGSDPANKKK